MNRFTPAEEGLARQRTDEGIARKAQRKGIAAQLQDLLDDESVTNPQAFALKLKGAGVGLAEDFTKKTLEEMRAAVMETINDLLSDVEVILPVPDKSLDAVANDQFEDYLVSDELRVFLKRPNVKITKKIISGGKTADTLKTAMLEKGIKMYSGAQSMLDNTNEENGFKVSPREEAIFITCAVKDLGFQPDYRPTTDEISKKVNELDLDKCRKDDGPNLLLQKKTLGLKKGDVQWAFSDTIAASVGSPGVFGLGRGGDGLKLSGIWASPDGRWRPVYRLILRLRKKSEA